MIFYNSSTVFNSMFLVFIELTKLYFSFAFGFNHLFQNGNKTLLNTINCWFAAENNLNDFKNMLLFWIFETVWHW